MPKPRNANRKRTAGRGLAAAPHRPAWWIEGLIAGVLVLLTALVYAQVAGFEFVNYDDTVYVPDNPHVSRGFSLSGIGWAVTSFETANWYPLTWFSLMLDCQVFGVRPGGHHLVNAILHAGDAILLFFVLRRTTAARWRSAAVAALFAAHPLHVESVAWIAERKDVLSTLFFLLTLLAYQRYAAKPGLGRWSLVFLAMALGLMAKPMLVTLPLVLLLLDFWPLKRIGRSQAERPSSLRPVLVEKLPLAALSLAASAVTLAAQANKGAMTMLHDPAGLSLRLANAAIAYAKYLGMLVWPVNLAVYYPYDFHPSPWLAAAAGLWLAALTAAALACLVRPLLPAGSPSKAPSGEPPAAGKELRRGGSSWRGWPAEAAAVGWLWYLVTLLPVIGLVQVGSQAMADRYGYLPSIGIFLAAVWLVAHATRRALAARPRFSITLAGAAATILAALLVAAHDQAGYWADSESLFRRALAVTGENPVACENLGDALLKKKKYAAAEVELRKVLKMDPEHYHDTREELARAIAGQGRIAAAMAYVRAIPEAPQRAKALHNLAIFLAEHRRLPEAIELLEEAIALAPEQPMGPQTLAWIYATCPDHQFRDGPKAVALAKRACELSDGKNARCRQTLADAYMLVGDWSRAAGELQAVLELNPGDQEALQKLESLPRRP